MNIILVTAIYSPQVGGPSVYASDVSKKLRNRGHKVEIITLSEGPEEFGVVRVGKVLPRIKYIRGLLQHINVFRVLFRRVVKMPADVIYVQTPGYMGAIVALVGKLRGIPFVLRFPGDTAWERAYASGETKKTLHEFLKFPEGGIAIRKMLAIQKYVIKSATRIVVPSIYMQKALVCYYDACVNKVHIIYHSVDVIEVENRKLTSVEEMKPVVLYVGRLVAHKKVEVLIDAFKSFQLKYQQSCLRILGGGVEEYRLSRLVDEFGLSEKVSFCGDLSRVEVLEEMTKADILVLPSLWESLSHVAIEAIAQGVPVVASDIPGLNEVLQDGHCALLVNPGDPVKLCKAMMNICCDPDLSETLVKNGKEKAKSMFSWDSNLPRLETVLNASQVISVRLVEN